ncbi:MAG: protein-export chaperone SecB [Gammaproteobacteria bacterium CG_4_10_14_0_8_um_filter_38_16]|nr:MAG: protein-export chaperone SecB [Gammaproteobacteria bacterium CG_4_10_14_0_8_um_filter_38_16]PJA03366.1 MAG: protein-export chaperone SecB [Gammaproteobacteria bacterium CG_4_10_14_0_2_um_filter_38_22]PJB11498.1 MAG: protein-export chaperone SecB [Gammaproteobacteria bacterium CG_4_9_14_3_um_filter_38_9]
MVQQKTQKPEETEKKEAVKSEGPEFAIQRLYVKDLSLETPNTPKIFLEAWEPQMNMDIGTDAGLVLEEGVREVVLKVTVTVKVKDKVAFLVEVKQAGIFMLKGFTEEQLHHMLGSFCPNILYPYAREVVTDAVVRAGFPQLYLAPVNFDALYEQQKEAKAKSAKKE